MFVVWYVLCKRTGVSSNKSTCKRFRIPVEIQPVLLMSYVEHFDWKKKEKKRKPDVIIRERKKHFNSRPRLHSTKLETCTITILLILIHNIQGHHVNGCWLERPTYLANSLSLRHSLPARDLADLLSSGQTDQTNVHQQGILIGLSSKKK